MESYCKLSILKLKVFVTKRPLDLYIRLSEHKFIKVASKDTPDSIEVLDSFAAKGLNSLYVRIEDFNSLMVDIEANINQNIRQFEDFSSLNEQYDGLVDLLEDTKSLVVNLGLDETTCRYVDNLVQKTIYSFSKWDSIEVLAELLLNKDGYIRSHAILCSFVATSVLKNIEWSTDAIIRKVIMASLFQNICLDKDDHARIYDRRSKEFESLEAYDKDRILIHAQKAAKLLDYGEFTGFEVAGMVKNHHELPIEGGFPRGKKSAPNLTPLESLFIISSYFAHRALMDKTSKFDFHREIQDLNEIFYSGNFKKSYEYFLKTFR